ncbi:MAG: pyruvate, phosphate dikinase [Bacteroidota bacterium]
MKKYVYVFGKGKAEGKADMKSLLGGKGANLAEMTNIGLPVPPGFTITTQVCTYYYKNHKHYPRELESQAIKALRLMEKHMGRKFGDARDPLLVSVRSGAPASMPGMMDTILNLGLNDQTVQGLIQKTKNPRFAYDSYRRFIQMYGDVVLGLKPETEDEVDPFEAIIEEKKKWKGVTYDTDLDVEDLKDLVRLFKEEIKRRKRVSFPEDPMEQLWGAIGAVFGSWMNDRAIAYRKLYSIPESLGTAVNVQGMVFGNMGNDCGTGVMFTRDPATGENTFYGEYLMNAQGEDVVAGIRTPLPISKLNKENPKIYKQLIKIRKVLESHYRDMQDIEFTIQAAKLYMLQTRSAKRTGFAAIRIAVDMVDEKLISEKEALLRIEPDAMNQLLRPVFDMEQKQQAIAEGRFLAKGLNAGPGAASGKVVFSASDAVLQQKRGDRVILVRIETSPEDIKGMNASEGILTARGGMTSHAALVARQMGKVCVAGCGALQIDYVRRQFSVNGHVVNAGDHISIDGSTGEVLLGKVKTRASEILQVLIDKTLKPSESSVFQQYQKLISWADKYRRLKIRTNADQPDQCVVANAFGAEGIGLCRTEHMFFGGERIDAVREMILAKDLEGRRKALKKLLPMQRSDFVGIFKEMNGKPVTIRTLDPPLHEFLPHTEKDIQDLAAKIAIEPEAIKLRLDSLHEFNPMLGHRGCRLGVVYPEITEMQAQAIFEAVCEVKRQGIVVIPEVMIPLVGHVRELKHQEEKVRAIAKAVMQKEEIKFEYQVGTMIELPRAAMTAGEIAKVAEFFSYGTNDLTQTTFGLSRDDAGRFLQTYYDLKILDADPFATIDQEGVGELMKIGVERGRRARKNLKVGVCGEHGGDPASVEFCHRIGVDYVSCSPFRVPIARLAAARAGLADAVKSKRTRRRKPRRGRR